MIQDENNNGRLSFTVLCITTKFVLLKNWGINTITLTSTIFCQDVALFLRHLIILAENSIFLFENETDQSLFFKQQVFKTNNDEDIVLILVYLIPR